MYAAKVKWRMVEVESLGMQRYHQVQWPQLMESDEGRWSQGLARDQPKIDIDLNAWKGGWSMKHLSAWSMNARRAVSEDKMGREWMDRGLHVKGWEFDVEPLLTTLLCAARYSRCPKIHRMLAAIPIFSKSTLIIFQLRNFQNPDHLE